MLENIILTTIIVFTACTSLLVGLRSGIDIKTVLKLQRMQKNMPNYKFTPPSLFSAEWFLLLSSYPYTRVVIGFCTGITLSFIPFIDTSTFTEGLLYTNAMFWGYVVGRSISTSSNAVDIEDPENWRYASDYWNRPLALTPYNKTTAKVRDDMATEGSYFYLLIMAGHASSKGVDGLYTFRSSTPVFDEDRLPIMGNRAGCAIAVDNMVAKQIYSFMHAVSHQGVISNFMVEHGLDVFSTPFVGVIYIPTIGSSVDASWSNAKQLILYNECAESDTCPCLWYQNWRTEFLKVS